MKFEESAIWDDPFVQDIRKLVDADLETLNKLPAIRAMIETDTLDPLSAGVLLAASGTVKGKLPARVEEAIDLLKSNRLKSEGPGFLFKAEDTVALKITIATLVGETTGAGLAKFKEAAASGKYGDDIRKGIDILTEISDRLVESGAHNAIEPKLVERFAEGLDNMKQVEPFSSRRKMLNESSAALKYAMMQGNAADVAHHAPRVDPDSQFIRLKNEAKSRFKL